MSASKLRIFSLKIRLLIPNDSNFQIIFFIPFFLNIRLPSANDSNFHIIFFPEFGHFNDQLIHTLLIEIECIEASLQGLGFLL